MVVGFVWGGWVLGSTAERMAKEQSTAAVTQALVPVCVSRSKADPDSQQKLKDFTALGYSYAQEQFVEKSGWATIPGSKSPDGDLAKACAAVLLEGTKA